jgi:hypothetical protein
MKKINLVKFFELCRSDAEFMHSVRYMTGTYKIGFGEAVVLVHFNDGKLSDFEENASADAPAACWTMGPAETWEGALKPVPEPGYHWFRPMMFYHGMQLSQGDAVVWFPMQNRFLELLREFYNGGMN